VARAEELLGLIPQSAGITAWLALSATEREQSLTGATMTLDVLRWAGDKCSSSQRLSWPRETWRSETDYTTCSAIPYDLELATAYLAASVGATGSGLVEVPAGGGSNQGLSGFEGVTLGPIKVEVRDEGDDSRYGFDILPGFVQGLIEKYLGGVGVSSARMVRRSVARHMGGYWRPAATWTGNFVRGGDGQIRRRNGSLTQL